MKRIATYHHQRELRPRRAGLREPRRVRNRRRRVRRRRFRGGNAVTRDLGDRRRFVPARRERAFVVEGTPRAAPRDDRGCTCVTAFPNHALTHCFTEAGDCCPYIAIYSYQKGRLTSALTVCPYIAIYATDTLFYLSQQRRFGVRRRAEPGAEARRRREPARGERSPDHRGSAHRASREPGE